MMGWGGRGGEVRVREVKVGEVRVGEGRGSDGKGGEVMMGSDGKSCHRCNSSLQ